MKYEVRASFVKQVDKMPPFIQIKVAEIIEEIEDAKLLSNIGNCKR